MAVVTTRADFEELIDVRLQEARCLIDQIQDWDGAYYLAGYAVEYALKVRIIALLARPDSLPEKKLLDRFYSHNLADLRGLAELDIEMRADRTMNRPWEIVKDWKEDARYQVGKTEAEARNLDNAVANEVLPWIKARWSPRRSRMVAGSSRGSPPMGIR